MFKLTSDGVEREEARKARSGVNALDFFIEPNYFGGSDYLLLSLCRVVICIYETSAHR